MVFILHTHCAERAYEVRHLSSSESIGPTILRKKRPLVVKVFQTGESLLQPCLSAGQWLRNAGLNHQMKNKRKNCFKNHLCSQKCILLHPIYKKPTEY
jgi:hypothetical protein